MPSQRLNIRSKELVHLKTSELVPSDANWRIHSTKQREALVAAVRSLGWIAPILVSKRTKKVLDGHLRLEVAKALGMDTVPCVLLDVDEAEEQAILASTDLLGELAIPDFVRLLDLKADVVDQDLLKLFSFFVPADIEDTMDLTLDVLPTNETAKPSVRLTFSREQWSTITSTFASSNIADIIRAVEHVAEEHVDFLKAALHQKHQQLKAARKGGQNNGV